MEHLFCSFFVFEWVVRFNAFRRKIFCLQDRAFMFDSCLAFMMVLETWALTVILQLYFYGRSFEIGNAGVLRLFRLVRICRMARVLRLLRALPELMVLIKGVASASRSVFFTLCLLLVVIFMFGVAFRQLAKDTEFGEKYFENIFVSMFTLLMKGTLPDMAGIVYEAGDQHFAYAALLLLYIFVAFLTILNLLVGVIVQVVGVVAQVESEGMVVKDVRRRLLAALKDLFPESKGEHTLISKADVHLIVSTPDSARAIHDLGVDVVGLLESEDFIFCDDSVAVGYIADTITFGAFMEAVLQLRGSNQATVKDIIDLRRYMLSSISNSGVELASNVRSQVAKLSFQMNALKSCSSPSGRKVCKDKGLLKRAPPPQSLMP